MSGEERLTTVDCVQCKGALLMGRATTWGGKLKCACAHCHAAEVGDKYRIGVLELNLN